MEWWEKLKEQDRKKREESTKRWNKLFGNTPFAMPPVAAPPPQCQDYPPPAPHSYPPHAAAPPYPESYHPPPAPQPPPYDPRSHGGQYKTGSLTAERHFKRGEEDGKAQEYKPPHAVNGFVGHFTEGTFLGLRPPFDMYGKPRSGPNIHRSSNPAQQADIDAYNEGFKLGRKSLSLGERMQKWWL